MLLTLSSFAGVSDIYTCFGENTEVHLGVQPGEYLVMVNDEVFRSPTNKALKIDNQNFSLKAHKRSQQIILSISGEKGSVIYNGALKSLDCRPLH